MTAATTTRDIRIPLATTTLPGLLTLPDQAGGLVIFAHGSGSSRASPRNRRVADRLNRAGLATLLFDLLDQSEEAEDERSGVYRFDIDRLAERLVGTLDWVGAYSELAGLPIGLFGASTGAAAALVAAAYRPRQVAAVVSRGGRADMAGTALAAVECPVLLLVGARDSQVLQLNQAAAARLGGRHELVVVPGASHLFEEPGTLEQVADQACGWFVNYLCRRHGTPSTRP